MYRFRYHITVQDILDFNEFYLLNTNAGKKSLRSHRIIVPVTLIIIFAVMFINDISIVSLVVYPVAAVVFCIVWQKTCHKPILSAYKSRLKKQSAAESGLYSPDGEIIFDFDNRMIIDIGAREETRVKFSDITACFDGKSGFYLYYSSSKAIILPYSSFFSPEECFSFQAVLHSTFPSGEAVNF